MLQISISSFASNENIESDNTINIQTSGISTSIEDDSEEETDYEEEIDSEETEYKNMMRNGTKESYELEKQMYDYLMKQYNNEIAACAIIGNAWHESALCPYRVQADVERDENGVFKISRRYTDRVINGEISEYDFAWAGMWEGGFGLFNWTAPGRKENLYRFAKEQGKPIDDWQMQLDFAYKEITERYFDLYYKLLTAQDIYKATQSFAMIFEQAENIGFKMHMRSIPAREAFERYGTEGYKSTNDFGRLPPIHGTYDYLEETLTRSEDSDDKADVRVFFAQTVLRHRGYYGYDIHGFFTIDTEKAILEYQLDHGLEQTGALDRDTWAHFYIEQYKGIWTDEDGIKHYGDIY